MIVQTAQGPVRGVERDGYHVFYGLPYAAAPTGDLRFRAPQPPAVHAEVLTADAPGPVAPQLPHREGSFYWKEFYANDHVEYSEDCLHLTIWTPEVSEDAKLPVAVWIHGGAFRHGYASEIEFDGAHFARAGVVQVNIQYRVDALGFLCHPWFRADGMANGNRGLLDQIAALRWVKENIAGFGGDPDNVTIFGQSAGAMSIQNLCGSPQARGLFAKAILQSGGGYLPGFDDNSLSEAEENGAAFVDSIGVTTLDQLCRTPYDVFLRAQYAFGFGPAIDGSLLPAAPGNVIEEGSYADVAYMMGYADGDWFTDTPRAEGQESNLRKACVDWSLQMERQGRKPAYVYRFARKPLGDDKGAFHSSELWYVFGTLASSWRPKDKDDWALSARMSENWIRFICEGDPNKAGETDWRRCRASDPFVMEFR